MSFVEVKNQKQMEHVTLTQVLNNMVVMYIKWA